MDEKLMEEDEEKIRGAMLANCIETLNEWTTGELLFLNHFGKPQQGKRIYIS